MSLLPRQVRVSGPGPSSAASMTRSSWVRFSMRSGPNLLLSCLALQEIGERAQPLRRGGRGDRIARLIALLREPERDAAPLAVEPEDGDAHRLAALELARPHLGDVDQPLDAGGQLDEGAERLDARDGAGGARSLGEPLGGLV